MTQKMHTIDFAKYSGAGNDFILIDNRSGEFPSGNKELIKTMCARRISIGADGLILLENSEKADLKMRYFNSDSSEAEMCGNGARCFIAFAKKCGIEKEKYTFETMERILTGWFDADGISIAMGDPIETLLNIALDVDDSKYVVHYTNLGVPHTVLFVDDVEKVDVVNLGRKIRFHPKFKPKGTNVDFVQIVGKNSIKMRVYERGVENETLASGTGVTASTVICNLVKNILPPVKILVKSGDTLTVNFEKMDDQPKNTILSGPATLIYEGKYFI